MKAAADELGLRSKQRCKASGKRTGGVPFDRDHIHQILTNPLYAGRIKHKTLVHEGQHEAIITPERWDRIQTMLQDGASKNRARKTAKQSSLLCGKIYDETGDRLTPSHSKTKAGTRLRYYVSHRLIKNSGAKNKDGWRLPAAELESKVAHVIAKHLKAPSFIGSLFPDATAAEIADAKSKIDSIGDRPTSWLDIINRIDLKVGELSICLDHEQISKLLDCHLDDQIQNLLALKASFQIRKRGVETKLIFADAPSARDETLIKNIAKAHHWFQQIKAGKTFSQIAANDQTSKRRIQQIIELAFLAPDIIRDVLEGTQPLGLTSDWCKHHSLPVSWTEQRTLIATL